MSHQQRLSRLGRRNQHPLPLPTTGSAVQLQPRHRRPDQYSRLSRKRLWFVGRWLARRPLLGPVQQATPRSLPAGIETTPALDSYDSGPSGVFGFWLWRRRGLALDFFVSDSTGLRTKFRIRMLTSEPRFFGYGMVAVVGSRHFAVAIPQKACHGLGGVQSQRLLEDIQALAHCSGGVVVVVERLLLLLGCESECEKAEKQSQECDDVHQLFGVVREVIACADEYMSSSPQ